MGLAIPAAFGAGLILVYIIGRSMMAPFKFVLKLLLNAVLGAIGLFVINYFGGYINLHIPVNPITALVVGFLGVPGIFVLIVVQYIILK